MSVLCYGRNASGDGSHKALEVNSNGALETEITNSSLTVDLGATDNAVLDSIVTNTTGLNSCVDGSELQVDVVSGVMTCNAGSNLNTSSLALESGGNLATIAGDTTSMDAKMASLGQKTKSGSMPVTLASDEDALNVIMSSSNFGSQANLWDGASVILSNNSSVANVSSYKVITIFGHSDGVDAVLLQVSEDNSNFYTHSELLPGANGYFAKDITSAVKYVRLEATASNTITATCLGKN